MISPRTIITAAHCFHPRYYPDTTNINLDIAYHEPGLPSDRPRSFGSGIRVNIHRHPNYVYDTDLPRRADHDLVLIELVNQHRWPGTTYRDYARLYQDRGNRIPEHVYVVGRGFRTVSGRGEGTLRGANFEVRNRFDWRVSLWQTETTGLCKGDSGSPYFVPGTDLIVAVHSGGPNDRDGVCGVDDGWWDPARKRGARTVWRNMLNLINQTTHTVHADHFDHGPYDYKRLFPIPYINEVENEGEERNIAVATIAAL